MGTHLRELRESYPMNTNMTGFRWFLCVFAFLYFGQMYTQHMKGYNNIFVQSHGYFGFQALETDG